LSNLEYLLLSGNQLCGKIPSELINLDTSLGGSLSMLVPSELMSQMDTRLGESLSALQLQNNNLINDETVYDADFIAWLDKMNPEWRAQVSPSYCSLLQFSAADYNVNEGDGSATLTVTRSGDSQGAVSVDYVTSDGSADNSDYTATSGTLEWDDGDTESKPFTVPIIDDSEPESDENFFVSLDNPIGDVQLGTPETAVVTIKANDSNQKMLSVIKSGSGKVTSSPAGIDCGTDCSEDYDSGTEVTLTAAPEFHSIFTGWSGSCTGTDTSCTVTMDTEHTVNANFEPDSICDTVIEIPNSECEALVKLYDSTDGDNWINNTGWNKTYTPCNWYGVSCSGGHVSQLSLYSNQLSGEIPPELGQLSRLQYLWLDFNQLSGEIPQQLGDLSNLKYLWLDFNQLSGEIPAELGKLSRLQYLWLSSNQLSGEIPQQLGDLSNLKSLYLDGNQLSGEIPQQLGDLSNLNSLYLYGNQLCGKIPEELMNLDITLGGSLSTLDLQKNHLINNEAVYDADFIEWLYQMDQRWWDQVSPSYCTLLQFSQANYNVNEEDVSVTLIVTRLFDNCQGAVSVDYATSDGTATAGSDYIATSGTLEWDDGDTESKTFTVEIIDDSEPESDETFFVSLSNPTGCAELGEPYRAEVTIGDNDYSLLQFSPANYDDVNEGDDSVTLTVTRSGSTQGAVSVEYATSDGTATAGSDYTATSGTLEWDDGDTEPKTFPVEIIDDSETESDETFFVSLDNPTGGARLGDLDIAEVTIRDNDPSGGTVVLSVEPAASNVYIGQEFEVHIMVQADTQELDGASAYLDFDTTYLEVVSMTSGGDLDLVLENSFDNGTGQINYAAGKLVAPFPSGTFELVTIRLRAKAETSVTPLSFVFDAARMTDASFGGESVFNQAEDGTVNISIGARVSGSVDLQRSVPAPDDSWETDVRVSFTVPSESNPSYSFTTTTDQNGEFVVGPVDPLDYDMRVKGTHTLQNLVPVSLVSGDNSVNVGELLEGDANDDNCVTILDFSILANTFALGEGEPGFDPRADFNQDTFVTILDFSLLATNFEQCGVPEPSISPVMPVVPEGTVVMAVVQSMTEVNVGERFEIVVEVQAGDQEVDGVSAYLNFDPTIVRVDEMISGGVLPIELANRFDNRAGTINFAAGTLSPPIPSGTFNLVTIQMTALAVSAGSALDFNAVMPRQIEVTSGGASVFEHAEGGTLVVFRETMTKDVVIDFGSESGIWAWMNNDAWADIDSRSPRSMVIGDIDDSGQDDLIADFSQDGIWILMNYNNWLFLHSLSAESMTTGDMDGNGLDDVIIDFGESYGIWVRMNNSDWTQLHSLSAESMTTGDMDGGGLADVIIDFGETYGIWVRMNNSDWTQLHSLSPESMTTGDMDGNGLDDVIIDFGSPYGIWVRINNSDWVKLHSVSPNSMTTGYLDNNAQADVIIDFGESYGIWARMNNDSWIKLHSISAESMVTGNIDGQASISTNSGITTQEVPAELDNAKPLPKADFISLP